VIARRKDKWERAPGEREVYDSLIGATIGGKYEVRRLLGVGAMGVVCEAKQLELGKRVALKLIGGSAPMTYATAQRFRREARAASAVESDHVVRIFDMGEDDEHGLFLVMELLQGEDLGARLERDGQLDVSTSVSIARQAAHGLEKLHRAGILHRDLKPANVFLVRNDEHEADHVKLLDLGICKRSGAAPGEDDALNITRHGEVVGTPAYMSPEQAQGAEVSEASDLYSLGVMLYEMLSGIRPHACEVYEHLIVQLVTQAPRPLRQAAPWVPASLAEVVDRMLEREPARRPESALHVIDALDHAMLEGADDGTSTIVSDSTAVAASLDRSCVGAGVAGPADGSSPRHVVPTVLRSHVRESDRACPRADDDPAEVFDRASLRRLLAVPNVASPQPAVDHDRTETRATRAAPRSARSREGRLLGRRVNRLFVVVGIALLSLALPVVVLVMFAR